MLVRGNVRVEGIWWDILVGKWGSVNWLEKQV